MASITLLDIAKRNGKDAVVGIIEESTRAVPEVTGVNPFTGAAVPGVGDARTIVGQSYKTLIRTGIPAVGFRDGNQGSTGVKSTWENRLVETFIMNPRWHVDRAIADKSEDGWQMLMADEASGVIQGGLRQLGRQFYYGKSTAGVALGGNAKGFNGLIDVYDPTNRVVDAGGTTDNTASSVWAVKFGPQAVRWVFGANGAMDPTEVDIRDINDVDGNPYSAYFQELFMYPGLQIGSPLYMSRIKKLTADNGKGLTDARLSAMMKLWPASVRPDVIFLSVRSLYQLRDSRTATTDDGRNAPLPTVFDGIPLVPTESIVDNEPLTL